jgi:type IV pilus assembly protein PilX
MYRLSSLKPSSPRAQQGAALITALLLLVVMTILAVTVMQMSRVQERMAGNTRDSNVALEAAEAAVRAGEATIGQEAFAPVDCSGPGCLSWAVGSIVDVANQPKSWWDTNGTAFADAANRPMTTGVAVNPQYVIEHRGFVRTDGGLQTGVPPVGRDFYEITGRSTGASGLANTAIQTTFARKF